MKENYNMPQRRILCFVAPNLKLGMAVQAALDIIHIWIKCGCLSSVCRAPLQATRLCKANQNPTFNIELLLFVNVIKQTASS